MPVEELQPLILQLKQQAPDFSGREADVYCLKEYVIKIFHKNRMISDVLPTQELKKLIGIPTKRILMPIQVIEGQEQGYLQKRIKDIQPIQEIIYQRQLLEEMKYWKEDCVLLSSHHFSLDDLNHNEVYNGQLYLPDVGFFKQSKMDQQTLLSSNLTKLNLMWISLFSSIYITGYQAEEKREEFLMEEFQKMRQLHFSYYGDYLTYCFTQINAQCYQDYYQQNWKKREATY